MSEKYDETLLPFLALMRRELHANASKGDRPGWLKMSAETALLEIYWHTAKLSAAVKNSDGPAIIEYSADVANMAMMLLDVCGGFRLPVVAPRSQSVDDAPNFKTSAAAEAVPAVLVSATVIQSAIEALDWLPTSIHSASRWERQQPSLRALKAAFLQAAPGPASEQKRVVAPADAGLAAASAQSPA